MEKDKLKEEAREYVEKYKTFTNYFFDGEIFNNTKKTKQCAIQDIDNTIKALKRGGNLIKYGCEAYYYFKDQIRYYKTLKKEVEQLEL